MIVIPAIDLKEGRCVRLVQGRMDQESVYSERSGSDGHTLESKGAERLHVVDLNGAVTGEPVHRSLIEEITRSIRIPWKWAVAFVTSRRLNIIFRQG